MARAPSAVVPWAIDHIDQEITMRSRARTATATAALIALFAAGCSGGISGDSASDDGGGLFDQEDGGEAEASGDALTAWPEPDVAASTTSPIHPQVRMDVRDVVRSADGLTTLLVDVANDTNDEVGLHQLVGQDSGALFFSLFDADNGTRHFPIRRTEVGSALCLCSSDVAIGSGETTTVYATFADIDPDVGTVRVEIDDWAPVPDVPVQSVGAFAPLAAADAIVEYRDDLRVEMLSVSDHGDAGSVLEVRYTNVASPEPVGLSDFPAPGDLSLVDLDGRSAVIPRVVDFRPVVAGDTDANELAVDESVTYQVLMAPLPETTEAVVLRGRGLRRSFPVTVRDGAGEPAVALPGGDVQEAEAFGLEARTDRFTTAMVGNEAVNEPPVDEIGPELPTVPVTGSVTSEPQPGWTVDVRGVVRGTGAHATLVMDLTRTEQAEDRWPESLGEFGNNLSLVRVIDPAGRRSYGPLATDSANIVGSSDAVSFDEGTDTRTVFAAFPDLGDAETVSVDLPGFGAVEDVPVVDGPDETDGAAVAATMRLEASAAFRMDVLDVGRLPEGGGTVVRTRVVNESSQETVRTPFAGSQSVTCELALLDPATGVRTFPLTPCAATAWEAELSAGESLVFETRFPALVEAAESVLVDAPGYLLSPPVRVVDDTLPWYLGLPGNADDPDTDTVAGRIATVDGAAETTQDGDTVEVVLGADVLFEFGSATLTPAAQATVAGLAAQIAEGAAGGGLDIVGHTDSVGDEAANQTLSEQRAEAVRVALEPVVARPDLEFEVSGRGAEVPVAPNEINGNDNPDGRADNRRVTVTYTAG
ncbi:MAG: OmpA family protein [Acidimicrobiales bacterium]